MWEAVPDVNNSITIKIKVDDKAVKVTQQQFKVKLDSFYHFIFAYFFLFSRVRVNIEMCHQLKKKQKSNVYTHMKLSTNYPARIRNLFTRTMTCRRWPWCRWKNDTSILFLILRGITGSQWQRSDQNRVTLSTETPLM